MAGRRFQRRDQRGAALLVFLVLLVMGALAYLVNRLSSADASAQRDRQTQEALAQARDALLGYATQYRDQQRNSDKPRLDAMYGFLPLPDFGESMNLNHAFGHPCNSEGCAKMNAAGLPPGETVLIGRLPWKTLGTAPLRDGAGECLWYAVAASHRAIDATATTMNWDTLATPDILIGSGLPDLSAINTHDRPIAVIFSAGPAFDAGRTPSPEAPICGGNYDSTHYLNPALANRQSALPLRSEELFHTLRRASTRQPADPPSRPPSFTDDLNDMLDVMSDCLRDQIASGAISGNGRINDACSLALDTIGPQGYPRHYRDQVFVATCPGCNPTIDEPPLPLPPTGCAGILLFASQRGNGQFRRDTGERNTWSNYLENHSHTPEAGDLESFNHHDNVYRGASRIGPVRASQLDTTDQQRCAPGGGLWSLSSSCQTIKQDIVRCIPGNPSQQTVSGDVSALFPGVISLASYVPAERVLTLGADAVEISSSNVNAGRFFGCSWQADAHPRGGGFHSYFRLKIRDTGDGFTFTVIDADRNPNIANRCGAARQHLGYSGNNGFTLPIEYPKIAIEFDTSRNANFSESGNMLTNGRNDPDYTPPYDNDSHVAILYWGYDAPNAIVGVTAPGQDDNVHGFPLSPDTSPRPAPRNAAATLPHPFPAPYPPLAIAPLDRLRDSTLANRDFHVRIEVTPETRSGEDEALKRRFWKIEAWIVPTFAKPIAALAWSGDPSGSGTATLTIPNHGFSSGDTILVRDGPGGFNGDHVITRIDADHFSCLLPESETTLISGQPVAMKLTEQVARMRAINQPMALLSPIVKANACSSDADCASGLSCAGAEQDGTRYCYAGHRPSLYDRQVIYDILLADGSLHEAFQSMRLGFTIGIGSSDQMIDVSEFFTQWIP